MVKLEMSNYNTILTEQQQKYQLYFLVKLINISIVQVKKYYPLIKVNREWWIYIFFFRKGFRKTNKKQIDALKSLNFSHKIDELKQIESIFPKNDLNDLIFDKLKEICNYKIISNWKIYNIQQKRKILQF